MKKAKTQTSRPKQKIEPSIFDDNPWGQFFNHACRLKEMRSSVEHGSVEALYDALTLLRVGNPDYHADWVLEACQEIIENRIKHGVAIGKDRTRNENNIFKKRMIHFHRWQAMEDARASGLRGEAAEKKALEILRGTPAAFANVDAIKKSDQKVRREIQHPHLRYQYYQALSDWLTYHKPTGLGSKGRKKLP